MSKYSRFLEASRAQVWGKEALKRWGANKTASQVDPLAIRAFDAKTYALGGLQDVCRRAGKDMNWIYEHIYDGLIDRRPELSLHHRSKNGALK
jgi:hypothetical protein